MRTKIGPEEHFALAGVADRTSPSVIGIGTAFPPDRYTQEEIKALLGIENKTVHKLLEAGHIRTRHLYFPDPPSEGGPIAEESHEQLIVKFNAGVREIGVAAVRQAMNGCIDASEIEFLICVTSSGFNVPGVSSLIARELRLPDNLYRLDVVGMGCNGGMSALKSAATLASRGAVGVLLCCEINSAIYVRDESVRTGIVNSLFGDGAAAVVLSPSSRPIRRKPFWSPRKRIISKILDFESFTLPEQWDAMRFDWHAGQKKWSFGLTKQIPFLVGENLKVPVNRLLERNGLEKDEIRHWTLHTGGAAVIEGAKKSLGLTEADVRHTRSVLHDHGNISSGSFLVSLARLLKEGSVREGDFGVWIAMGPGATLEACLVHYHLGRGGAQE